MDETKISNEIMIKTETQGTIEETEDYKCNINDFKVEEDEIREENQEQEHLIDAENIKCEIDIGETVLYDGNKEIRRDFCEQCVKQEIEDIKETIQKNELCDTHNEPVKEESVKREVTEEDDEYHKSIQEQENQNTAEDKQCVILFVIKNEEEEQSPKISTESSRVLRSRKISLKNDYSGLDSDASSSSIDNSDDEYERNYKKKRPNIIRKKTSKYVEKYPDKTGQKKLARELGATLIHLKRYNCHYCENTFRNTKTLKSHVESVHMKPRNFRCTICCYRASSINYLRRHARKCGYGLLFCN